MHQALFSSYAMPMIVVDGASFEINEYMTRGAELTGLTDSKSGILSVWVRFDSGTAEARIIGNATIPNFEVNRATSSGRFEIIGNNAAGTPILTLATTASFAAGATWRHFLASWDLANAAGHLYVNDASDLDTPTLTDDTIDYTRGDWSVGANDVGNVDLIGSVAELYFAPGQYLDLSLVSNRRKFISAGGKPVYLGSDGSVPTGTAPRVYSHLADSEAVANIATNRGTGGDFSITGTLATADSSPSD